MNQFIGLLSAGFIYSCFFSFGLPQAIANKNVGGAGNHPIYAFLALLLPILFGGFLLVQGTYLTFIEPVFFLYYVFLALPIVSSGNFRRQRRYDTFLLQQAVVNAIDALCILASAFLLQDITMGVACALLVRLIYLPNVLTSFSVGSTVSHRAFLKKAFGLYVGSFANVTFNNGTVAILNFFGDPNIAAQFYYVRLCFRPITIFIRIISDRILSELGAASFSEAFSNLQRRFQSYLGVFIVTLSVCTAVALVYSEAADTHMSWYLVMLIAADTLLVYLRNPYEISFFSFENTVFRPIQYFVFSNMGLLVYVAAFFEGDLLLISALAPVASSLAVMLMYRVNYPKNYLN